MKVHTTQSNALTVYKTIKKGRLESPKKLGTMELAALIKEIYADVNRVPRLMEFVNAFSNREFSSVGFDALPENQEYPTPKSICKKCQEVGILSEGINECMSHGLLDRELQRVERCVGPNRNAITMLFEYDNMEPQSVSPFPIYGVAHKSSATFVLRDSDKEDIGKSGGPYGFENGPGPLRRFINSIFGG